jgi:hypothetical protein
MSNMIGYVFRQIKKELDARLKIPDKDIRGQASGMTFTWSSFPQLVSGNPERINYDVFTQGSD